MPPRDYESAPTSEALGLEKIIRDLAGDLTALRGGKITVQDAIARSMLAKQIFNGVRIYLNGAKILSERAAHVALKSESLADESDGCGSEQSERVATPNQKIDQ